jgi:DNA-binding NtrC family response regulator
MRALEKTFIAVVASDFDERAALKSKLLDHEDRYQVHCLRSGREGFEFCHTHPIDCVVVGFTLKDTDWREFLELHQSLHLSHVPVVPIAEDVAHASEDDIDLLCASIDAAVAQAQFEPVDPPSQIH